MRQLDLQLAFTSPGAAGKDVENELRAVDDPAIERVLEVALLGGREVVVDDHEVDVEAT